MSLEKPDVRLGFIALTDCAPIVVAKEKGFFAAEGLNATLSREASWANVRDKLAAGLLDGSHLLGPMAIAQSLGLGGERTAMLAPLALNSGGSAVTVSAAVAEALRQIDPAAMAVRPRSAEPLKALADQRRRKGLPPLAFAVVFPYSVHNYELRFWLADSGVDPGRDVRITVVPPPRMVEKLAAGEIDGFCVGAPWHALAVEQGLGEIMLHAREWWPSGPDKVFGVTRDWAQRHPATLQALLRALIRAAVWADAPENRAELAHMLAQPHYFGVPARPDDVIFHRHAANFPWRSHALWFLSQMIRWGQAPRTADVARAASVYAPELYREAAAALGEPAPLVDAKPEGAHVAPWTFEAATAPIPMPADSILGGAVFEPEALLDYLDSFSLTHAASV